MSLPIRPLRRDDIEGCLRVIASLPRFFGMAPVDEPVVAEPDPLNDPLPVPSGVAAGAAPGGQAFGRRSARTIVGQARVYSRDGGTDTATTPEGQVPPGGRDITRAARDLGTQGGLVAVGPSGEVIAFLTWKRHNDTAAEVTWMAVHASLRHRGVGTTLVSRLERLLAAQGFNHLSALTSASSHTYAPTRAFWRSRGYAPVLELDELWDTDVALVLSKTLER
jgi:GNAT superfamily N-acetyltransferase